MRHVLVKQHMCGTCYRLELVASPQMQAHWLSLRGAWCAVWRRRDDDALPGEPALLAQGH
jgi:hypothetical protein